jgi:Uncharacterized protein conserved in bacteria (DUF2330)
MRPSRTLAGVLGALTTAGSVLAPFASRHAQAACCYFSALGSDVNQPSQKAFLTWDPSEQLESFTVQPRFEGNAADFGMVIPTPSRPRLAEMPRDFFKELAVFTILKPMPLDKYKPILPPFALGAGNAVADAAEKSSVTVIEAGIVGSLDYKIITAERADDLFAWLKENHYQYGGDQKTLEFYIQKQWLFTVMKIDPKQMKRGPDGSYIGDVTPTRFTFTSERLIYPLRITQISVPTQTEALFYVQAPYKVDLPGSFSYQYTWSPMWLQATSYALPEKLTVQEKQWMQVVQPQLPDLSRLAAARSQELPSWQPARLEWSKKLVAQDIEVLAGTAPFGREADADAVKNLRLLLGHLKPGQTITKLRKVFVKGEMETDLVFDRAQLGGAPDDMEYEYILPTSPP